MNRKYISLFVVFILIVLSSLIAVSVFSDSCCFLNYTVYSLACYESTQDECMGAEGEFFDKDCNLVDKCNPVCCIEAMPTHNPYPVRKGTCQEAFWGLPIPVSGKDECDLIYSWITPDRPHCGASCQPNEKDCVGRGRIVNAGTYYCWENNIIYQNQFSCTRPVDEGGCPTIGQCNLGEEITPSCYCAGSLYSSGFCCWNNIYTSDISGSNCLPANDCEKYPGIAPFFKCCDACKGDILDPLQHWSNEDSECAADYPGEKGLCCKECAPELTDCCDYEWQCKGNVLNYVYSSCAGIACDAACIESVCILNEKINSGVNPHPMCICAGQYYDTATDSRYCCPEGPGISPCEANKFNLEGYVYSVERSNKVLNANVKIETPAKTYTTTSGINGEYSIEGITMGSGIFNVSVIKEGYNPGRFSINYPSLPITLENQDFNIIPVGGVCDEANPPAVIEFDVKPVKGKKEVKLIWKNPCPIPSKVVAYSIGREPGSYLGTFYTRNTSFVDSDVEWSSYSGLSSGIKKYTYYIKAHYVSGKSSVETSASITMGHYYCEGVYGEEFCVNDVLTKSGHLTKRYRCDDYNDLTQQGVSGGIVDCSPGVCVGPDKDGLTDCKSITPCRYDTGNPFGLFYTKEECLSNGKNCYYDYSDTTVDDCEDCGSISDCYGYRSKDACETDNCLLTGAHSFEMESGENNPCEWHYSFEGLGKGLCYDKDYMGANYCGLCNKDSTVFYNLNCDQSICTKLGACYSKDSSCEPCLSNTKCEDLKSEESCVNAHLSGIRNVNIGECPTEIRRSDDACGLGLCKWGVPKGHSEVTCFKDANDDDIADCDLREGMDYTCKEDFEPFVTVPQVDIPKIGKEGYGIHLFLTEGGTGNLRSFYFCIDKNNSCCPNIKKDVISTTREIIINPIEETGIIKEAGTYFIRYYSVDTNSNIEQVKSTEFFVDPIDPEMVFGHYFYSEAKGNYTVIVAASDKYVNCNYNLNGIPNEKVESTDFNKGFNNTFHIKFKGLGEGGYVFTAACEDSVGNSVKVDYPFYVNFIYETKIGSPNLEVLNTNTVKFHLASTDDSDCTLTAIDASASGIPYHPLPGEPVVMDKKVLVVNNLYNHTKTLTLQQDASYVVKATCTPKIGGAEDSVFFRFTIDTNPPVTSTNFDFDAWHKKEEDLVTIKFDCNDQQINGTPGEAGCKGTYLCTGLNCYANENNYNLLINNEYQTNVNGLYVSYFSVDNGGNKEDRGVGGHYNKQIKIDGANPLVTITSPSGLFTSNRYQTIKVTARDDESQVDYVQIKIEKVDPLYESATVNATKVGVNEYRLNNARLYDGLNLITAIACDKASNCEQATHEVYLDLYPPEIGDIFIEDSDRDLDTGNIFEYKENLSFTVKIKDEYSHVGSLRPGIGVDPNRVMIAIHDSADKFVMEAEMVAGSDNFYNLTITPILNVGTYTAIVDANDYFGNHNNKKVSFEIEDTKPITLYLDPVIPDGKTVYLSDLTLTGFTEPGISVGAHLCNADCLGCSLVSTAIGAPVSKPKSEFANKPISELVFMKYPTKGDTYLVWKGVLGTYIEESDYLRFSTHTNFYKVTNIYPAEKSGSIWVTRLDISPALHQSIVSATATVSAYETDKPTGWFELPIISLNEGKNCIIVTGERVETGNTADQIYIKDITYISSGLNINQTTPQYNQMLYNSNLQSIKVEVTTNFAANCRIINPQDNRVAKQFNYPLTPSNDEKTHSIIFDKNSCSSPIGSGPFCYLNNDESTEYGIYHKYRVECTADEIGITPASKEICFGVATWSEVAGTQYGVNICNGATNCGGVFPLGCGQCTPNCVGKGCGDANGCGGICTNCPSGRICNQDIHQCVECTPNCAGKVCGSNGCGGKCGSCSSGELCIEGICIPEVG